MQARSPSGLFHTSLAAYLLAFPTVARAEKPVVLVLADQTTLRGAAATEAFKATLTSAVVLTYQVDSGSAAASFADVMRGDDIQLVFALGDVPLKIAVREFAHDEVVYADVTDPTLVPDNPLVTGISSRFDPAVVIGRLRVVAPSVRELGVLHVLDEPDPYWGELVAAGKNVGIRVDVRCAPTSGDVENVTTELFATTDAVWVTEDPRWSSVDLARLFSRGEFEREPIIGYDALQVSLAHPAAMAFVSDPADVGRAAARRANDLLGLDPSLIPALPAFVQPHIVGHLAQMRAEGLKVTKSSASAVDVWVGR